MIGVVVPTQEDIADYLDYLSDMHGGPPKPRPKSQRQLERQRRHVQAQDQRRRIEDYLDELSQGRTST